MTNEKAIIPIGQIEQRIFLIRGEKVIIDADLADFYGVPTKRLNEQIKRNPDRFPEDFMFQLTSEEKAEVISSCDHLSQLKFSKVLPYAFTEHGAIMAAGVLNSARAVEVGVFIVRAFVQLRQTVAQHKDLARKLTDLERKLATHDQQIISVIRAIQQLLSPTVPAKRRRIGFQADECDH